MSRIVAMCPPRFRSARLSDLHPGSAPDRVENCTAPEETHAARLGTLPWAHPTHTVPTIAAATDLAA